MYHLLVLFYHISKYEYYQLIAPINTFLKRPRFLKSAKNWPTYVDLNLVTPKKHPVYVKMGIWF